MDAPHFMQSPLVVWIQTFSAERLTYQELCDGIFLAEVMQQIDSKTNLDGLAMRVDDRKDRLQNWEILMMNINAFYKDVLQQHVVLQPPEINLICSHPESEASHMELERVLLLILGCAVQSEDKAALIELIKQLDTDVQCAIVDCIQTITDCSRSVFPVAVSADDMDDTTFNMYNHLCTLLAQRDSYIKVVKELQNTLEESSDIDDVLVTSVTVDKSPSITLDGVADISPDSKRYHAGIELAQCKAKLRRLRHELEEKCDSVEELQDELEVLKQTEQRMRLENRELLEEARAAKCYRDELDIVKEKASRVDKYELELTRLKEKLNELGFYRARVDELRADNSALLDTNQQLSDQLNACHKRIESIVDLENDLLAYKQRITEYSKERDQDQQRIMQLMRENARLEFDQKLMSGESCSVDDQIKKAFNAAGDLSPSLMDQLSETTNSQMLRLQLENQSLKRQIEEFKENALIENAAKMLELEKENNRLSGKVDRLLTDLSESEKKSTELQRTTDDLSRAQKNLEDTLEIVRETGERKVRESEKEKELLLQSVETMRERIEKTGDLRISDLENENRRLCENAKTYIAQIAELEYKNVQLEKASQKSTEMVIQFRQLEETNDRYRREVDGLQKDISILQVSREKAQVVEEGAAKVQIENARLLKTVELLQQNATKKEEVERENINLSVEVQQLKRGLESLKATSSQLAEVEHEKQQLKTRFCRLQEEKVAKEAACEQLETKLVQKEEQNRSLEDSLRSVSLKIEELQEEHEQLQTQNKKLQVMVDERKHLERKIDSLDTFSKELEAENRRLLKEKQTLEKENRKLKQASDVKDNEVDELKTSIVELENANKVLYKTTERCKELESCVTELEQENLELSQKMRIDSKTLATLRQELVNEKVKTQQLADEIGRVCKSELDMSQSSGVERAKADSKYRQREMKIEENFQKQVSNYEEQMTFMQQSLEESRNENRKLIAELEAVKTYGVNTRDRPVYVTQRYSHAQHSTHVQSTPSATVPLSHAEVHDDVRQLKNQLNAAEKQISKVQEESRNLKELNASLQSHINYNDDWQIQFLSVQSKFSTFQMQYNDLQSKLAAVQVENATLSSQIGSLSSQNSGLLMKVSQLESRHHADAEQTAEIRNLLDNMEQDHDALQQLHERLSREHEALLTEHSALKANHKDIKARLRLLSEQNSVLHREMETVAELRESLERGKANETHSYSTLQTNYIQVREENLHLVNANDKLNTDLRDLQSNLRSTKTRLHALKAANDELESHIQDREGQIRAMDMEMTRLMSRNSSLSECNSKLEEDNRTLMANLQTAMNQNQELLTQLLNAKDQRVEEHKYYSEKLCEVQYQKEKLEEKIQQSRRDEENAKNKSTNFATSLVKKLTIRLGKDRTKTAQSYYESSVTAESPESSSLGGSSSTHKSSENLQGEGDVLTPRNLEWPVHRGRRRPASEVDGRLPTFGDVSCGESSASPHKMGNGHGKSSKQGTFTNNDEPSDDSESITLDQFLQECNKSPKSRRKLLVEKRIILDDLPVSERKSDRLLATLPPRPATIYADHDCEDIPQLRHFKSEANVSRPKSSPASSSQEGVQERPEPTGIRRLPRRVISKQFLALSSAGDYQSVTLPSSKQPRSDRGNRSPYGNATGHQEVTNDKSQSQQQSNQPLNGNSRVPGDGNYQNRGDTNSTRVVDRPLDDNRRGNQTNGGSTRRPKSVPPRMLNQPQPHAPVDNCTDMGSQYEPGNVRHLVQSYQSAFRPPSTTQSEISDVTRWQQGVQGHASHGSQSRDLQRSLSVNQAGYQRLRASRQRDATDAYRTDVNVCVVRPANGRTLPEPPANGSAARALHDYQSTSRREQYSMSETKESSKPNQVYYESVCL